MGKNMKKRWKRKTRVGSDGNATKAEEEKEEEKRRGKREEEKGKRKVLIMVSESIL